MANTEQWINTYISHIRFYYDRLETLKRDKRLFRDMCEYNTLYKRYENKYNNLIDGFEEKYCAYRYS